MNLLCHVRAMVDGLDYGQQEKTHPSADTHPRRGRSVTAMVVFVGAKDRKNKRVCELRSIAMNFPRRASSGRPLVEVKCQRHESDSNLGNR
jgi:hypothetical protein